MKHIKQIAVVFMAALTLSLAVPDIVPVTDSITTAQAAVKISKKSYRLVKGASLQLKLTGTKKKANWTTSKRSVATVTQKGKVSAKKKGTATITAKIGKKKYNCRIYVETPTISPRKTTIEVGKSTSLRLNGTKQKVTWKSSNTEIATVRNGKVTGRKSGNVKITANVQKKKYTCNIMVNDPSNKINPNKKVPVTTLFLRSDYIKLKKGNSQTIGFTIYPQNATDKYVKWTSSNPSVASVSNGKITANSIGVTTITATCDNKTATCYVEVESDFDSEIAKKFISFSSQDLYNKCYITIKNNYKYPVDITATTTYYKNGGVVTRNSSSNGFLAPGKESILVTNFYNFWGDYDNHNVNISVNGPGEEICDASGVRCDVKPGENSRIVELTNTSNKTSDSTDVDVYFIDNGIISRRGPYTIYVKNVGSKETLKFDYSFDWDNITIIPDKFIVCLNGTVAYNENIK